MGYIEDPNNPGRMIPDDMPGYLKPHATTPRSGSVVDRPSHVIVAEDRSGLWFNFESTASLGYDIGTDTVYNASNNWVWLGTFTNGTRLDISPLTERKQIFSPQHSNGDPKLLGFESDHPSDVGFCHMYLNDKDATKGNYYCDTQGIDSGSPVLNYSNKKVAALHFWGSDDPNCETDTNSAHQMSSIWPLISTHFNNEVPEGDLVYDPDNGGTTPPANNSISFGENKIISGLASSVQLFSLDAASGLDTITVNTTGGTGDADLYIKFGSDASSSNYDCKSSTSTNNETCTLPTQVGTYSIAIKGYSDFSDVNLIATNKASNTAPSQGQLNNGDITADISLSKDETKQYFIDVVAGQSLVVSTYGGLGDTDLYVSYEGMPTTSNFDCRSWNSGNDETCEITNTQAGRYYIVLSGYKASEGISLRAQY